MLLELAGRSRESLHGLELTRALVEGRKRLLAERQGIDWPSLFRDDECEEIRVAIKNLKHARWMYLRDTTRYSIFMSTEDEESYAVLGLTDPIREVVGQVSMIFETAIFPLGESYVCDGLFSGVMAVGPNMRADYRELQSKIVKRGRFYKRP